MRNNAHLVHKKHFVKKALPHKDFTIEWVRLMIKLAHLHYNNTISNQPSTPSSQPSAPKIDSKRRRVTNFQALLDAYSERKQKHIELHQPVVNRNQKSNGCCVVCSALYHEQKQSGWNILHDKDIRCTRMICSFCVTENEKCKQ
eukprot:14266982-Ditylum_brightwellii.AAC.2